MTMTPAVPSRSDPRAHGRLMSLDVGRLVLASMVVLGHGMFFSDVNDTAWLGFAMGFARIIVPFFFMLTGYFFVRIMARGLGEWVRAMLIVYAIWTLVYLPDLVLTGQFSVAKLLFYLVTGYAHLWYLPAAILAGCLLYLLRTLPMRVLLPLSVGLLGCGLAVQWTLNLATDPASLPNHNAWYAASRNFLFMGLPYMAIGYMMNRDGLLRNLSWPWLRRLLIAAAMLMGLEVWMTYQAIGTNGFFDILVSALMMTPLVFARLLQIDLDGDFPWISPLSGLLYLVHPLIAVPVVWALPGSPTVQALLTLVLSLAVAGALLRLGVRMRRLRLPRLRQARLPVAHVTPAE